ncbi:MAG TPA: hypothetical protein VMF07_11990 [Solirubrobacteraceae bacterium]|nr:hypothetical protein [Solirubrobacteraceae bacterium]
MKVKAFAVSVATSAAVLGIGAGSSMAATLYTTKAHTKAVKVGTKAVGSSGVVSLYSGSSKVNSCKSSKLNLKLTQNSGGTVAASITGGTFSGCNLATTINAPWTPGLQVSGSGVASGANTVWSNTSVDGVSVNFAGGTYTGNLTTNIVAEESTTKGAPLTLKLTQAGTLSGPLTTDGTVVATYKLTGAAAKYSLG